MPELTTEFSLVDDRYLRALLVPYDEVGQNASGDHVFSLTSKVDLPENPGDIVLKLAHDGSGARQIAAEAVSFIETRKGIVADFLPRDNAYGQRLLEEHRAGRKKSVSPEFKGLVRDGVNVVKARLSGAAAVVLGGFPSAAFFSLDIADEPTEEVPVEPDEAEPETPSPEIPEVAAAAEETPEEKEEPVATATVPNTLAATSVATEQPITEQEVFAYFEAMRAGRATPELHERMRTAFHEGGEGAMFALNDVKYNGTGSIQPDERRSQWIDLLWNGRSYEQQVVPLFKKLPLTSRTIAGFKWTTKPTGGDWSGNKANIPTNTPVTAAASATAAFWAMGHDHAIEFQIFDTPGYWESYFRMGVEDFAAWEDAKVLAAAIAGATSLEADNPAGLDIGAGFSALIDGAAAVITDGNALPTFALVAPALWKAMLKTPADNVLGYLSAALKLDAGALDGFVIRPHASLSAGNVLVGAGEALTVYELPEIVKVQAPDTVKGGIDTNMISAVATLVHKATALQLVTPYTA
ncbi:MAG: hypothetical protein JWP85_988 [Rhodoglobus sp.]|nr:hypothetical protein [Rhodoglobus sp.]